SIMKYDIFFSISQTPVDGDTPSERQMLENFFEQVELADQLGFGIAWIAQAHLSTEVQKRNRKPVVPHWQGEVGLCTDFFQLAHQVFARTSHIEVGSAVMSILCNGGPIGVAERIANFCTLHAMRPGETRKLHVGFSAGRFEFMARPYGIVPRDSVEEASWPALRGQIFMEAGSIMLSLLDGRVVSDEDTYKTVFTRSNFRSDADWERVQNAAMSLHGLEEAPQSIEMPKRYRFEDLKIIPQDWPREYLSLIMGTHDPRAQRYFNTFLPVKVFNLSITKPEVIEKVHQNMQDWYHDDGGGWQREYMPRTTMVFVSDEPQLSEEENRAKAQKEAQKALSAYWSALQGTIDPVKVQNAAKNALIGSVNDVVGQITDRFNPKDRLMLWFDFFNHDSAHVCSMMRTFQDKVIPQVEAAISTSE
ncbi:MAG: LLM class flavin-dependent oxidoreductase, partial [Myxococcota bacterium]|nr:LLM class flavin-dependent oxidoreductase [Myxococcota bacterium]